MKSFLAICFFLMLGAINPLQAQVVLRGTVMDAESGEPVSGARVGLVGSASLYSVPTDEQGKFEFKTDKMPDALEVSRMGYERTLIKVRGNPKEIAISLQPKDVTIETVLIQDRGIERVLEDKNLYLLDYAFYGDHLFVILQDIHQKRPVLALIDERDSILDTDPGLERPESFFQDCLGNVHVLGEKFACQLHVLDGQIIMYQDPIAEFEESVRPCQAYLGKTAMYKRIRFNGQLLDYLAWNREKEELGLFTRIMNKEKIHQLLDPYSIYAGIIASEEHLFSMTEIEWAQIGKLNPEFMFQQRAFFYPIPAPIKVIRNDFVVFDHTNGSILTFTEEGEQVSEVPIEYQKERSWQREDILIDEIRGEAWAVFKRGTWTYLREIDLDTGQLSSEYEIPREHISRISVRDGVIYFLYREANYEDINRLFRWRVR